MQENTENIVEKRPAKRRWLLIILGLLLLLFAAWFTTVAVISSNRKIDALNKEFAFKPGEKDKPDERIFSDSAFVSLNREKAWFQARNIMAETDSISLSLDLPDSLAILEINGVAVHTANLLNMKIPKAFYSSDEYAVSSMLSIPFTVVDNISTIKKEPLMLKVAPKDTSEYKPDILPDTTNRESVNYIMNISNGFRLYIYQATDDEGGALNRLFFDLHDRFKTIWYTLKEMIRFRIPEYNPSIRLVMKKEDAKIIFRALPVNGQIAVRR